MIATHLGWPERLGTETARQLALITTTWGADDARE